MKHHLLCAAIAVFCLSGCGLLDAPHARPDDTGLRQAMIQPAPAVAPVEPAGDWCARVAAGEEGLAKNAGFDAATQQRQARNSYAQCMRSSETR